MKKILPLSAILLVSLASRSNAQTFLVDLFQDDGNQYVGNAATDFGVAGTVTNVAGSVANSGYGTSTTDDVYTLGSVGTITLSNPYFTYNNNGNGNAATTPYRLTGSWVASGAGLSDNTFTFDLSDLPTGDTVSIGVIAGDGGNGGPSISINGGTATIVPPANSDGTGMFTNVLTGGTATSYTMVASTSNYNYGGDEADITGILVTVSAAPEPSTWAMLFAGMGGLLFLVRRRARLNS